MRCRLHYLVMVPLCAVFLSLNARCTLHGSEEPQPPIDLDSGFRVPAESSQPWAYWWWVKGNVTEESITRDLEQMKQKGFTGLLMFDARGSTNTIYLHRRPH